MLVGHLTNYIVPLTRAEYRGRGRAKARRARCNLVLRRPYALPVDRIAVAFVGSDDVEATRLYGVDLDLARGAID